MQLMNPRCTLLTTAVIGILLASSGTVSLARAQDGPRERRQTMCLLYLLEDLMRSTHAEMASPNFLGSTETISLIRAKQVLADQARQHIKAAGLHADLLELFDGYKQLLSSVEPLEKALKEREDLYLRYLRELGRLFLTEDMIRRAESASRVTDTAVRIGLETSGDAGDRLIGGLLAGFVKAGAESIRLQLERRAAFAAAQAKALQYEREHRPQLLRDLRKIRTDYLERLRNAEEKLATQARRTVATLAERNGWETREVALDPFGTVESLKTRQRTWDPFRAKQVLHALPHERSAARAQEEFAFAQECLKAVATLPKGRANDTSVVFLRLRTSLCATAGESATRLAAEEIGDAGFAGGVQRAQANRPVKAALVAIAAWENYRATGVPMTQDEGLLIFHRYLRALGCAGKINKANELLQPFAWQIAILKRQHLRMTRPVFRPIVQVANLSALPKVEWGVWYDFARLRAVVGDNAGAINFLDLAVKSGFRDSEKARNSPDFERLRLFPDFDRVLKGRVLSTGIR